MKSHEMDFRRHNQRRRRVAIDQSQQETPPNRDPVAECTELAQGTQHPYASGARRNRQPKTTDLIPKRYWTVAALLCLLVFVILVLNWLHFSAPNWIDIIGADGVQALSLESGRGIAAWYSSFLMLLTCCVSLQLFLLRQHRRDDYRGSYRIWMWLAALFLLASMLSVAGIHQLIQNAAGYLLQVKPSRGITVLVVAKLVGLLLLVTRGVFEMRYSRAAMLALAVVFFAYATATLIELPPVQAKLSQYVQAAQGNCLLIGPTALLSMAVLFARFVYMQANGLAKVAAEADARQATNNSKEKASSPTPSVKTSGARLQTNKARRDRVEMGSPQSTAKVAENPEGTARRPPVKVRKKTRCKSTSEKKNSATAEESARKARAVDDEVDAAQLSKSERRRQRKLKRREQKRAAA